MGNRVFLYNPLEMNKRELFSVFSSREAQSEYLMERIREQLDHNTVQHILIIGPRGAGKTTLLHYIQYKIKDDPLLNSSWQLVQFAEEEWGIYSLVDFFVWILERILEDYPETEIKDEFEKAKRKRRESPNDIDPFTSLIESFCSRYGKKILLLTDNFDYIIKKNLNGEDRAVLRKYLLFQKWMMIIATAVALFPEVEDYEEPFFDFFAPVYLHRLSVNQGAQLIRRRAEYESGFSPQAERIIREWEDHQSKIKTITELTDGNPRLLLMLYEIMKGNPLGKILDVFNQLMDDVTPYLKSVMDQLSNMQCKIVDTLSRSEMGLSLSDLSYSSGIPANSLSVQLNRLEDMTFIKREKRNRKTIYVTGNKLFRTWYKMRVLRKNRRIYDLLVNMLNLFYSEEDIIKKLETCAFPEEKRHYIAALRNPELRRKFTLQMAEDYVINDSYEEAREEIESVIQDASSEVIMQIMLLKEGKLDETEKSLKKSTEKGDSDAMNNYAKMLWGQGRIPEAEKLFSRLLEHEKVEFFHKIHFVAFLFDTGSIQRIWEFILSIEKELLVNKDPGSLLFLLKSIIENEKFLSKFKTLSRDMDYSGSESLTFLIPVILAVAEFHENKTGEKLDQLSSEQRIIARVLLSALGYKTDETMGAEDSSLIFGKITS